MKFFAATVLAVISLSSSALAAPLDARQVTTPVGAINSALSTLEGTVIGDEATINSLAANARNDVTAQAQIAAQVSANIQGIETALQAATAAITSSTTGAAVSLSASDIAQLQADVNAAQMIAMGIATTLANAATAFTGATRIAVMQEAAAANMLLKPFTTPLFTYASSVSEAGSTAGSSLVNQLAAAVTSGTTALNSLIGSLMITV